MAGIQSKASRIATAVASPTGAAPPVSAAASCKGSLVREMSNSTSRSSTSHSTPAPSAMSRFDPAEAGLRIGPGTAATARERCAASVAVSRAPPSACDSTTTQASLSAAMIRLRAGNRQRSGAVPSGASDSSSPRWATIRHSTAFSRG